VTAPARPNFDAQDLIVAFAVALLAQLVFVLAFSLPSPKLIQADISNDNGQPIAVSITPVLKLGTKTPTKIPAQWQRKRPVAAKSQAALPSTQAEKTAEAIPKSHAPDASVGPAVVDAGRMEQPTLTAPEDAGLATTSPTEGSEQGAANGTETDPLKGRAVDMYRGQLQAWFAAHFHIRGKLPFDTLKTLHASVDVTVTEDRKVGTFSVVKPSGDPFFDAEVNTTLSTLKSGGVELPAPPPMYPELLGKPFHVAFACNIRKLCE
jgi:hypothetical protein